MDNDLFDIGSTLSLEYTSASHSVLPTSITWKSPEMLILRLCPRATESETLGVGSSHQSVFFPAFQVILTHAKV